MIMVSSLTSATNAGAAQLTFEQKLRGGSRPRAKVPLCLNGEVRQAYEEVERRVVARLAEAQQEYDAAADAAEADPRMSTPTRPPFDPPVDPEQPLLDELAAELHRWTELVTLEAMNPQAYSKLIEQHPPREGADGKRDPRDLRGVNAETFYPILIRESIIKPVMDDELFDQFMDGLGYEQRERLIGEATMVNRKDDDVPLLLSGSVARPGSDAA